MAKKYVWDVYNADSVHQGNRTKTIEEMQAELDQHTGWYAESVVKDADGNPEITLDSASIEQAI